MNDKKESNNRQIKTGEQGNYNESIAGDYVQGDAYYFNVEPKKKFPKICKNQETLDKYLPSVIKKLKQKGFIEFRNNLINDNQNFKLVARNASFDMSISLVPMRGEAFFLFSEFEQINFTSLKSFASQCLNYAKTKTNSSTVGSAVWNFKVPNNLCFVVALVDEIDAATRTDIQQINPFKNKVDALWYEIPVVYELKNKKLYFYERPLNWQDKFTGEIAWKEIRPILREALEL